ITEKMAPILAKVPAAAAPALAPLKATIDKDPQTLFGLLIRPDMLKQVPEALRTPLVQVLKESMVGSLHTVFLVGLALVCAGVAVSLFMGNARLDAGAQPESAPVLAD
ncbi:MAG TPA: hypothetical protein VNT75_28405, partial [Symbiobacteriaceae bacterium]|nr:hypothetical protein [Symbiobacteriaceae bacterium]